MSKENAQERVLALGKVNEVAEPAPIGAGVTIDLATDKRLVEAVLHVVWTQQVRLVVLDFGALGPTTDHLALALLEESRKEVVG